MKYLTVMAFVILCLALAGCSSTTLHTPLGDYTSTRDSQLDELFIEITESPDGTKTTIVHLNGASGQASPVIAAQTDFLRALFEAAFTAGKIAGGGG